jgi:predicted nucleic acid-binding protein
LVASWRNPSTADQYFISVISEMELLSYPLLEASAQAKIEGFLSEVTVVALGDAIRLRREHQIKLPDAIVATTALSLGAPLLTNDIKLRRIPGLSCQELKLK